jgi:hypothetical protein
MPAKLTAAEFLKRLKELRSPAVAKSHTHLASDDDDVILGVRMGQVFALAKEFMGMELDEVEKMLESPIHEMSIDNMIQTFEFEGYPGHVSLDSMILEELPGNRTKVTIQSVFLSVSDRDGMIQNGMEKGVSEGYERLDDILAKGI